MAVSKKCLACNLYRDDCRGWAIPCGKWMKLDLNKPSAGALATELATEPAVQPAVTPAPKAEPIVFPTAPCTETRRARFERIGAKRQEQALEAIRKLSHLVSKYERVRTGVTSYTYEWTKEMAQQLLEPIEDALHTLEDELLSCANNREHGLIGEKNDAE